MRRGRRLPRGEPVGRFPLLTRYGRRSRRHRVARRILLQTICGGLGLLGISVGYPRLRARTGLFKKSRTCANGTLSWSVRRKSVNPTASLRSNRAALPSDPYNPRQLALTLGTRLGPYEILSALGAGGMGEVYRARDTKLNRDVAIKILPDAFAHDPDRLARFSAKRRRSPR